MSHWNLRKQLAQYLEEGNIAKATSLLHEQAEHFIRRSEGRAFATLGRCWLEDKARWLIHAVDAIPELARAEKEIEVQRRESKTVDAKLVSAVERMQEYVAACAFIGQRLYDLKFDRQGFYPAQPRSREHSYDSPLSYLNTFGRPRPPVAFPFKAGRPRLYETIETKDYDHRLFVSVATDDAWAQYFRNCVRYFRKRFEDAHASLEVRILLELSRLVAEKEIGGFNDEKAQEKIKDIREAYDERNKLELSIAEQLAKIDYFYACLRSCESYGDITPLFLPNIASPYYGKAPLGMPYYASMDPDNIHKFYSSGHDVDDSHGQNSGRSGVFQSSSTRR